MSSELYMFLGQDLFDYYDLMRAAVGDEEYASMNFILHATHNHHGPDTSGLSGPVNSAYYTWMIQQSVDATLDSLQNMREVELRWDQAPFQFGLADIR
jgi:hypothetical protein